MVEIATEENTQNPAKFMMRKLQIFQVPEHRHIAAASLV